jgi:hypothetical protein
MNAGGSRPGAIRLELRHLRCFIAVAEELHFARAAERLHIEQSPLSRAIKELEEGLGVQLFVRTTRSTRLTRAGTLFLDHVPRIFTALQQARDSVKAAANGFHGQLRVALSDGIPPSRFPIARSVVEGFINAAFFVTQPVEISRRALEHRHFAASLAMATS